MKPRPLRNFQALLRRLATMLPLRYRCAALLFGTVILFPFILLAMSASLLFSAMLDALGAASRWFGQASVFPAEAKLELRDLPAASVSVTDVRS